MSKSHDAQGDVTTKATPAKAQKSSATEFTKAGVSYIYEKGKLYAIGTHGRRVLKGSFTEEQVQDFAGAK